MGLCMEKYFEEEFLLHFWNTKLLVALSLRALSVNVFSKVVANKFNFSWIVFTQLFPDFKGVILLLFGLIIIIIYIVINYNLITIIFLSLTKD